MDMALYIVDRTMYFMVDLPVISPMWMKDDIPGMFSQQMDDYQILMGLLQIADMEMTGTERKEGVNCYVLETTPDIVEI